MMMSAFTNTLLFALVALLALVSAAPISFWPRDVYAPPITSPTNETVWVAGSNYNVTWNTTGAPVNITNPVGTVYFATNGTIDISHPLATNFSILDGWVTVTAPEVSNGSDYSVVLFGDSGNFSPEFTIVSQNQTESDSGDSEGVLLELLK